RTASVTSLHLPEEAPWREPAFERRAGERVQPQGPAHELRRVLQRAAVVGDVMNMLVAEVALEMAGAIVGHHRVVDQAIDVDDPAAAEVAGNAGVEAGDGLAGRHQLLEPRL